MARKRPTPKPVREKAKQRPPPRRDPRRRKEKKEDLAPPRLTKSREDVEVPETGAGEQGLAIVGIGASAGGLEACSQLLGALPPDTGMALVLVQHLAPRHPSVLPELLQGTTRMPVLQATDGMKVEGDHIYVIPPNTQLSIVEGILRLLPRPEDHSQFMPIDFFFRSLAEYAGFRAVGIILSGTASDGAQGLREIKGVGGITVAQEPKSARYDGMPRAAIATGLVDMVLTPEDMAKELERLSHHPFVKHIQPHREGDGLSLVEDHYQKILQILRAGVGVDFTHYKQPTIRRRLKRRMVIHKILNIEDYIRFLRENPLEVKNLYQDILIHVTRFFREPQSFQSLVDEVFPRILENRSEGAIRVWIPGCSTGEEAYSISIALHEFLEDRLDSVPIQIFGTDISEGAINQARSGIYPGSIAEDVSPGRLRRHFSKIDGNYRISKEVRDRCVFARQDLTRDPPFSKLDLILCRNVLIYLEPQLQKKLLGVFHYALKTKGYLMLGSAETTGPNADLFTLVNKRFKVYLKKSVSLRMDMEFSPASTNAGSVPPARKLHGMARTVRDIQTEASQTLIARYAPPGVLVSGEMEIIQFLGQTGDFLEPSPGDASLNLFKMAREGLLFALRSAVNEARKCDKAARRERIRVRSNGQTRMVSLEVIPITRTEARHYLILFEPAEAAKVKEEEKEEEGGGRKKKVKKEARARREELQLITRLEEELAASREYLQSIIQDLEAANEELQSANEEILSANEELQSTNEELDTAKEELQSTNEELNTVNEELHGRNEELSRVNSDLLNLLGSVQIAIVMVSSDLRIRRFTPMAEKVLNLIPSDIGRPITDIKPKIDHPGLEGLIRKSIENMSVEEQKVQDRQGNSYLLRVRPYRNLENRIEGAVLTLFEVAGSREHEAEIKGEGDRAESIVDTVRGPSVLLDSAMRVKEVNQVFLETFGLSRGEVEGRALHEMGDGRWNIPALRPLLEEVLSKDVSFEGFRVEHDFPGLGRRTLLISSSRLRGSEDGGDSTRIFLVMEDITGQREGRKEERKEGRKRGEALP